MPGESREYDLIRVLDDQADSKRDTFFISPKEIGRDGSGLQTLTVQTVPEPDRPDTDQQTLFLDSDGILQAKQPDGTVVRVAGSGGVQGAVDSRVIAAGETVTVDSDESLTLTGPVDITGTLDADGGVTIL